jgi:Mini-chromosome maintenance replisome factor
VVSKVQSLHIQCRRQVYDENEALKLNEVVEFVGVLSRAPELGTAQDCCGGSGDFGHASELFADEAAARPPTSQVCCLLPCSPALFIKRSSMWNLQCLECVVAARQMC